MAHVSGRTGRLARAYLEKMERAVERDPALSPLEDKKAKFDRLLRKSPVRFTDRTISSIRPDIAAVAILTARAFEAQPALVGALDRGAPVVVSITTHVPEMVPLVHQIVNVCMFPGNSSADESQTVVLARDGSSAKEHVPERGNDSIAPALHKRSSIIGIAPNPKQHLPRDLLRAAEYHVVIGSLDPAAISLVIKAVTGKAPSDPLDAELARTADILDLCIAVHRDLSPEECVVRLGEIIRKKGLIDATGPSLEELSGYGDARQWGLDLASDLQKFREGHIRWEEIEKSLLLAGPPGVGKTQYAKALSRSLSLPLISTSVADWNSSPYLSGTLSAMKNVFAQARRLAPSGVCVFIDELDGISNRGNLKGEYVEYWSQIVNLLLESLSFASEIPGTIICAATNFPEKIDPAVLRRFDRTIHIEKPSTDDLVSIFRHHLKNALKDDDVMPVALAARGATGANVAGWVRRARGQARRAKRDLVIDDLLAVVTSGRPAFPPKLARAICIHEAGHIIVASLVVGCTPSSVSIIDTGAITTIDIELAQSQTLAGLQDQMIVLLAGRAAEEVLLAPEEVTAGAGLDAKSDFSKATRIAMEIETKFGFGSLGVLHLPDEAVHFALGSKLLAILKDRLDACQARAREIVTDNRQAVIAVAEALEARRYLEKDEIDALLKRHLSTVRSPSILPQGVGNVGS
jgi:hypothetical protein